MGGRRLRVLALLLLAMPDQKANSSSASLKYSRSTGLLFILANQAKLSIVDDENQPILIEIPRCLVSLCRLPTVVSE